MNEQQKAGPTALGKLVLIVFVGACIAGAAYYFRDLVAPGGRGQGMVDIDQFRKVEAPDRWMDQNADLFSSLEGDDERSATLPTLPQAPAVEPPPVPPPPRTRQREE
jgi:hypothetical protein